MVATFDTNANELDAKFLESIKAMFRDSRIRIKVETSDFTSPNQDTIDDRIRYIENGGALIQVPLSMLQSLAKA